MENTTPPQHGIKILKGANPIEQAARWITDQTGDPTYAIQHRLLTNGMYTYKVHGEILVRAEVYDVTGLSVQVWFNKEYLKA